MHLVVALAIEFWSRRLLALSRRCLLVESGFRLMNLGQVAKDKNLLLVVEKNLVMNEIQNLSTWLSKESNGGCLHGQM
jgi:hypothetical protein